MIKLLENKQIYSANNVHPLVSTGAMGIQIVVVLNVEAV